MRVPVLSYILTALIERPRRLVYLSYPQGTLGHPPDLSVILRLTEDGNTRDLLTLPGGQGTINVASWAPDSRRFAFVAYPFGH